MSVVVTTGEKLYRAQWPAHPDFRVNAPGERAPVAADPAYLVFDCETVRDPMFPVEYKEDGVTEKFPCPAEWEVVSCCGVVVGTDGRFVRPVVFGRGGGEEAMTWDFARVVEAIGPGKCALVSWNGRAFDVPVLTARLLRWGWRSPFHSAAFRKRYVDVGGGTHLDLCDQLSDYGAAVRGSLDKYVRMIGLPGKVFGDGASVADMVAAGRREEVDLYCLTDVLQTAFLLVRHLLLRGELDRAAYREVAAHNLSLCRDAFGGAPVDEGRLLLPAKVPVPDAVSS